jgi:hypothetical protein
MLFVMIQDFLQFRTVGAGQNQGSFRKIVPTGTGNQEYYQKETDSCFHFISGLA